jgi:hypothetical protein
MFFTKPVPARGAGSSEAKVKRLRRYLKMKVA